MVDRICYSIHYFLYITIVYATVFFLFSHFIHLRWVCDVRIYIYFAKYIAKYALNTYEINTDSYFKGYTFNVHIQQWYKIYRRKFAKHNTIQFIFVLKRNAWTQFISSSYILYSYFRYSELLGIYNTKQYIQQSTAEFLLFCFFVSQL